MSARVPAAVTLPLPDGVAHVQSPRRNVELDAPVVPGQVFAMGSSPLTSVARATGPNVGNPAALPCRTVIVEPSEASVADACKPPPTMSAFSVSEVADVSQVGQATVPLVVIVPPVSGELNVRLVSVPEPGGAAHVLSPRRKVDADAPVPLAILVIKMFPVISVAKLTGPKVGGPAAFPCNVVNVVPSEPSTLIACKPPPSTSRFNVSAAAEVVQVGQPIVPVLVIVPPVNGPLTTKIGRAHV